MTGYSRGTVDRVVHNRGGVKPEVAQLIRAALSETNYMPNKAGRVLVTRRNSLKIGCFMPGIGNDFFEGVVEGYHNAEAELSDFGVSIHVKMDRGYDVNVHLAAIDGLVDAGCQALCLTTIDVPIIHDKINRLIADGIPVITVNTDVSDTSRLCYVGSNYRQGGQVAAALLAKWAGAEELLRILIVTGSLKIKGHKERIEGFEQTLRAKGTHFEVAAIRESLDENDIANDVVKEALAEYPETNCIFLVGGGAAGACMAIRDSGIREKHTLRVISFDDVASTKAMILNGDIDFTICQEPQRQGHQAVTSMFNYLLSNEKVKPADFCTQTIVKMKENI